MYCIYQAPAAAPSHDAHSADTRALVKDGGPSEPMNRGTGMRLTLLIVLVALPQIALAQQAQQQNPQQPEQQTYCFEVYRSTSGPTGAILLNKCTGQSWILIGQGPSRWYPLPTSNEEYSLPPTQRAPP